MNSELLLAHFQAYLLAERRVSQNTFAAYWSDINQYVLFLRDSCGGDIAGSGTPEIKKFLKHLYDANISAKSLARKISSIKLLYRFLSERFNMPNHAATISSPKLEQTLPVYLTNEEITALLAAAEKDTSDRGVRNALIVHMLYATGMRVSELCGLRLDQIRMDTGFINLIGKGNKERSLPLPVPTLQLVRNFLAVTRPKLLGNLADTCVYVFGVISGGTAQAMTRQSVWNVIKHLIAAAGITKNISPHSLRHSIATHLLCNGTDVRSLQMLLGHENVTTVQVYTHLETKHLREIYDKKHPRAQ